jgi:hypothetical protein
MLPTEDLFVYIYMLIDDAIASRPLEIRPRPDLVPSCCDTGLMTIARLSQNVVSPRSHSCLMGTGSVASVAARAAPEWGDQYAVTLTAAQLTDVRLCEMRALPAHALMHSCA